MSEVGEETAADVVEQHVFEVRACGIRCGVLGVEDSGTRGVRRTKGTLELAPVVAQPAFRLERQTHCAPGLDASVAARNRIGSLVHSLRMHEARAGEARPHERRLRKIVTATSESRMCRSVVSATYDDDLEVRRRG